MHQPAEELVHGDALLAEQDDSATVGYEGPYTLKAIHSALEGGLPPPCASDGLTTWGVFVGYLVLDAIVGNTDRHQANWAVIKSGYGRYLAPTFDHASSLGFLLSDRERLRRLSSKDRNYTPAAFADRAKTPFAANPHPIDALAGARRFDGGDAVDHWLNQPRGIDDLVAPVWEIPEHRMSIPAREFAKRVIRRNWERLTQC